MSGGAFFWRYCLASLAGLGARVVLLVEVRGNCGDGGGGVLSF